MVLPLRSVRANYLIGKPLGRGSFGDVVAARSLTDETRGLVALKILRHSRPPRGEGVEWYEMLREVIFFRNVSSHRNLVDLLDMFYDEDSGNAVFALELMKANLCQVIQHHRNKDLVKAFNAFMIAKIMEDLLKGLAHIHKYGFAHRDVKPENILLAGWGPNLIAKLSDFGLSRSIDEYSGGVWTSYVATRWYRTPEQLLEISVPTLSIDIWAASLILYEVCNLQPLFAESDCTFMIEMQLKILGIPSLSAVGGPSRFILRELEALYGRSIHRQAASQNGYTVTPEWLRWEKHECFAPLIVAGLQWDPARRPSALQMLQRLRIIVTELARSHPAGSSSKP